MSSSMNCTNAPDTTASDAGVAGAGVLLAFIITAGIALILSSYIIIGEFRSNAPVTPKIISRKLLNSFSDQQIVEGIGIQAVGLAKMNTMVPYHFFIVWMLAMLSTATHLATLLALVQDFKRDWVLRWLRQGFMFINLLLNVLYGIFVLQSVMKDLPPTLAIGCVWKEHAEDDGERPNKVLSIIGTIAVIAVTVILFALSTWYLHMRKQRWGKIVRSVGLILLMALGIGAAVRVIMVSAAFGSASVKLSGPSEASWSFGQLLTMLILILPFISALEIFRGEIGVSTEAVSDDQQPLNGNELKPMNDNKYYYQPSPFSNGAKAFRK